MESRNLSNGLKVKRNKSTVLIYKVAKKKEKPSGFSFISSYLYIGILSCFNNLNRQLNKRKNCNNFPAQY